MQTHTELNQEDSEPAVSLIAAVANDWVLGHDGQMPWDLPADLAYFRKQTTGKAIIMGRKTYQSIGKALPNRINIVLTRDTSFTLPDARVVHRIDDAITFAKQQYADGATQHNEIMIIGGSQIYQQAIHYADKLYITHIEASFPGDCYFPDIDTSQWQLVQSERHHYASSKASFDYAFCCYRREY